LASSATWMPKLSSHTPTDYSHQISTTFVSVCDIAVRLPSFTLYNKVMLLSPEIVFSMCAVTCKLRTVGTSLLSIVSSWKCVAKRQKQYNCFAIYLNGKIQIISEFTYAKESNMNTYSEIAHAKPKPSDVLVPRPSSSITSNEFAVAV